MRAKPSKVDLKKLAEVLCAALFIAFLPRRVDAQLEGVVGPISAYFNPGIAGFGDIPVNFQITQTGTCPYITASGSETDPSSGATASYSFSAYESDSGTFVGFTDLSLLVSQTGAGSSSAAEFSFSGPIEIEQPYGGYENAIGAYVGGLVGSDPGDYDSVQIFLGAMTQQYTDPNPGDHIGLGLGSEAPQPQGMQNNSDRCGGGAEVYNSSSTASASVSVSGVQIGAYLPEPSALPMAVGVAICLLKCRRLGRTPQ